MGLFVCGCLIEFISGLNEKIRTAFAVRIFCLGDIMNLREEGVLFICNHDVVYEG